MVIYFYNQGKGKWILCELENKGAFSKLDLVFSSCALFFSFKFDLHKMNLILIASKCARELVPRKVGGACVSMRHSREVSMVTL